MVVAGSGPLTYQWLKEIRSRSAEANGATLTLNNVSGADTAGYSVIVSNPGGSVTSVTATLIVLGTLTIVSQPSSCTNYAGTTATFAVIAGGHEDTLTYQWLKNWLPDQRKRPAPAWCCRMFRTRTRRFT